MGEPPCRQRRAQPDNPLSEQKRTKETKNSSSTRHHVLISPCQGSEFPDAHANALALALNVHVVQEPRPGIGQALS